MNLENYQNSYIWKEAVDLADRAQKVSEEIPADAQETLGLALRQSLLEVPAAATMLAMQGDQKHQLPVLKLAAALEMIERVYPAIDLTEAQTALATVTKRLVSPQAAELIADQPEPTPEPETETAGSPSNQEE